MKKLITGGLLALLMAGGGAALADRPSEDNLVEGGHPALFGLCNAWSNNGTGREHGNAENAPPFQSLQDAAADEEVEAYCEGIAPGNPAP